MDEDQIKYLLTLPPEEIVKWYMSKGYTFSWSWKDVWKDAQVRSFTVAKVMKLDILQSIKDEVDKIFTEGVTYDQFVKNLEPELKDLGWWDKVRADQVPGYDPNSAIDPGKMVQLGSPRRLSTIYQTNANVAYNAARYKFQTQNMESRPYWLYNQIDRPSKRKAHERYAGKVFRADDPIWDKIYPPNGFNCGCFVTALTAEEVAAKGLIVQNGANVKVKVGEGWDYNPGKELFSPDLSQYDADLSAAYRADNG